jgi:type I restriction enzyme R subunit
VTPVHRSGYSEDALIEQPAFDLLQSLGWKVFPAMGEFDEVTRSPIGRETKGEVVLIDRLRAALEKLNPDASPDALSIAIEEICRDRSRLSPAEANRQVSELIRNSIAAKVVDPETDDETVVRVRVIDWEDPKRNDFLVCSQLWITGEMYTRRADVVGFVNGLPLVFIELKATHRHLKTAFTTNFRDYKDTIPHLFWHNALVILSNGTESRIGSITGEWEHFAEWKRIGSEDEAGRVSLETMLRGTCDPVRLLDIVENFILFSEVRGGLVKLVAKNHQYLGVTNAMEALSEIRERQGRLGVFWHTQGSGKSVSMIFFSQKVLRKVSGNWTFVIVTDRKELDGQIYGNFVHAGAITEPPSACHAESADHLRQLLRADHRYVFTLIHKFRTERGEKHPVLSTRDDIIVITDEAHRSQYDTLAMNMRTALPNASFLAFTGTPLIVAEEKTRQVFGDYVSIYDFKQSVDDGATVPLYYENRIPELQLQNENLNEDMERLLEDAELDDEQEKKLEREFAREYHLITRDDRLEAVAKDIVNHFTGRGFPGKAMVVSIDKATAIRMYDKVRTNWAKKMDALRKDLKKAGEDRRVEIEAQLLFMAETDMAVVISQGQNEIADMRAKGLDIRPHRKRMVEEDLDAKFKDPDDPLRLVFVCAMWMTGFDVPSCSTIYLDKPMRNHTLMQTIARANRVFPEKVNGLIVDYVGVFRNLEKALAIYGSGGAGTGGPGYHPVEGKQELVEALRKAIDETTVFCRAKGVDVEPIRASEGFECVRLLDEAVEKLVADEETKQRFITLASAVNRLFKAVKPDPIVAEVAPICAVIEELHRKIRALNPDADITEVMADVEVLLDRSIEAHGYEVIDKGKVVDLATIDFEALRSRFEAGRKHTETERLKGAIARRLATMIRLNRSRMDYLAAFQKMIEDYNAGSGNVEEFFKRLVEFVGRLDVEDKRGVAEQLSEEELAVFDILTKPEPDLTAKDQKRVKKVARDLLNALKKGKLVLDWRKRQQARAQVKVTIENVLDAGLPPTYTPELFRRKTEAVFQHVYESYWGIEQGVYARMGA